MTTNENYNPLEKKHIAESVIRELLNREAIPLGEIKPFDGVGVYAIYYVGDFPAYGKIKRANAGGKNELPIYVGKAVPKGARKGVDVKVGQEMFGRLREHADSIRQTTNLRIDDFLCRFLNVDDIWIPLGESMLIETFRPLWNVVLDGFGNHDPGKGRYQQMMSKWDIIHPGRAWAMRCKARPDTASTLLADVKRFLA